MFLTYSKSLPAFYQEMVQLEMDAPDDSKVYVGFHEGFLPLAAKYYEAIAPKAEVVLEAPAKEEVKEPVKEEPIKDEEPVKEEVIVDDADAPVTKKARKTSV